MSAASPSRFPMAMPLKAGKQMSRIGPLAAIILLHVLLLYALLNGLPRQAAQAMPREVFVSLITSEPTLTPATVPISETPGPPAVTPETVPAEKKAVKARRPVAPVVRPAPVPQPVEMPAAAAASLPDPPTQEAQVAHAAAAPTVPPALPAPSPPKTVSGVEYLQMPQPDYPSIARRMGEEGKVVLRILVNEKGYPERIDVRQSSGYARLDEAARRAAERALFKPHLEDGRAVAVYALVPINFSIQ